MRTKMVDYFAASEEPSKFYGQLDSARLPVASQHWC